MQSITLAGGCFWCLDAVYRQVKGVISSKCGYTGGRLLNPDYQQVSRGTTGHAEAVQIIFEPDVINEAAILDIFWSIHDPTSLNRQGADVGSHYRSAIFYKDEAQKKRAEVSRQKARQLWAEPIVTEITPLGSFYEAEDYHQNYFAKNPERGYCQVVINPKIIKARQSFAHLIK